MLISTRITLKEVIFENQNISHLARIYFRKLASLKYFAVSNFREIAQNSQNSRKLPPKKITSFKASAMLITFIKLIIDKFLKLCFWYT